MKPQTPSRRVAPPTLAQVSWAGAPSWRGPKPDQGKRNEMLCVSKLPCPGGITPGAWTSASTRHPVKPRRPSGPGPPPAETLGDSCKAYDTIDAASKHLFGTQVVAWRTILLTLQPNTRSTEQVYEGRASTMGTPYTAPYATPYVSPYTSPLERTCDAYGERNTPPRCHR